MTLPKATVDVEVRRTRALANGTRRRLLTELRAGACDVRGLAATTGLHANGIRHHLLVLRDAGLVSEEVESAAGRVGRPRVLYRAAPGADSTDPFARLSRLLLAVVKGGDPVEVGRAEGRASARPAADATDAVADAAAASGFAVSIHRDRTETRISLHGCPFADLVDDPVCALHRGVIEGATEQAGGTLVGFDINHPTVAPCTVILGDTP